MSAAPSVGRRVGMVTLSLGLVMVLGALARVPMRGAHVDEAALRLTWRLRGEEAVVCRRPTEAELADLPVHMRNPDACVGELPPFLLHVDIDGERLISRMVSPSGVRGDRPLFVYDELFVSPGRHQVAVTFGLEDPDGARISLRLDTAVVLARSQVLLITRAEDGTLEVRTPAR